jgi:transposase
MITEPEHSGKTISDVCVEFEVSRETWYNWKGRYDASGVDGLKNQSRKPHNIKYVKVTEELEKLILELRLNSRLGPMRIKYRLKRKYEVSLSTKTIYKFLKRHKLNVLSIKLKRKYKRFEMKHPNELVQMDGHQRTFLSKMLTKQTLFHSCYR